MSKPEVYSIDENGDILTLYSDDLVALGAMKITRASNVEPDESGKWSVQLSDDPALGEHKGVTIGSGFTTRAEALDFEVAWINKNILGRI
jgi:hypothetical protein